MWLVGHKAGEEGRGPGMELSISVLRRLDLPVDIQKTLNRLIVSDLNFRKHLPAVRDLENEFRSREGPR